MIGSLQRELNPPLTRIGQIGQPDARQRWVQFLDLGLSISPPFLQRRRDQQAAGEFLGRGRGDEGINILLAHHMVGVIELTLDRHPTPDSVFRDQVDAGIGATMAVRVVGP